MNFPRINHIVETIFLLNGILFILGGGYLVLDLSLTVGQFLKFFLGIGILNLVRAVVLKNQKINKNLDLIILLLSIVIAIYFIGYLQMTIALISAIAIIMRWRVEE